MNKRLFWVVMVSSLVVVMYTAPAEAATMTGDQTMPQHVEKRSMGTEKFDIGPQRMDVKSDTDIFRGTAPKPATEDSEAVDDDVDVDDADTAVEVEKGCVMVVGEDGVSRMVCAAEVEAVPETAVPVEEGNLAQVVQQGAMGQQAVSEDEDLMEQQSPAGDQSEVAPLPNGEGEVDLNAGCRLVADDFGNTKLVCADVEEDSSSSGQLALDDTAMPKTAAEEMPADTVTSPAGTMDVVPEKAVAPAPVDVTPVEPKVEVKVDDTPDVKVEKNVTVEKAPAMVDTPAVEQQVPVKEEAGAAASTADEQVFTNDEKGYSITFPAKWEVRKGMMGLDVIAISPMSDAADNFRENINVVTEKLASNINLDAYYKAGINALKQDIPGFEITETKDVTIGGIPGKRILFKHNSGDVEATVIQYILVEDGKQAVLITAAVRSDEMAKYMPVIDKVADSLHVTK